VRIPFTITDSPHEKVAFDVVMLASAPDSIMPPFSVALQKVVQNCSKNHHGA
jgi:hypothetical protein